MPQPPIQYPTTYSVSQAVAYCDVDGSSILVNPDKPLPVTIGGSPWARFSGNCCEPVWEESETVAKLYLDIQLASGSLTYRLAQ